MWYEFVVGDKTYKLKLSVRNIVLLEKKIGVNPLSIFGANGETIPTVGTMVAILHYSLQQYNHGLTEQDAYTIFEQWLEDGNSLTDFIKVILEIYKVSGLIKQEDTQEGN